MKSSPKGSRPLLWAAVVVFAAGGCCFAQGKRPCTNATLRGRYAFTESGTIEGIGPVAVAGVFDADGRGSLVADDTVSVSGMINQEHLNFAYQVNPDCTGKAGTVNPPSPDEAAHFNFVIIGNGSEAVGIHTDPGTTLLLHAKKMFAGNRSKDHAESGQGS